MHFIFVYKKIKAIFFSAKLLIIDLKHTNLKIYDTHASYLSRAKFVMNQYKIKVSVKTFTYFTFAERKNNFSENEGNIKIRIFL